MAFRTLSAVMRTDKSLETLLYKINYERIKCGLKRLTAKQFTARIANKYSRNEDLTHDEFIKF